MKTFENPTLVIQPLHPEELMLTSNCFETFECKECYCTVVTCDPVYNCTGLNCPRLEM